jgi:inosine-uridine nucleoside N-ribohydrolase
MVRKILLDTDPGIDDAVALTMALFDPRLEVQALTAVAGNVNAEQATRNVQAIVDQLDPPRLPRIGAATVPDRELASSVDLYGADGLGNANFPVAELHQRHASEKVLYDEIRTSPGNVTVLALGPLTNVASALRRDPNWATQVGHIIFVGGTVTAAGNVTAAAEFNAYCDPTAAQEVFHSPTTKTLIPLDVTEQIVLTYDLFDQLPNDLSRAGRFLRKILPYAFRSHRQYLGMEGIPLHDAVGVVAALHPELFTFQDMSGDVETAGVLTLGATVFDRRRRPDLRPNMAVAVDVDASGVIDAILRSLQAAADAS